MITENLKTEFNKIKVPQMEVSLRDSENLANFVQQIRKQDREDERYLFRKRLIPILMGIVCLTFVLMISPIKNIVLFWGYFLVYVGLVAVALLSFLDYKNISKEKFDMSLLIFLRQKEARLMSWKSTPLRYYYIYTFYVIGVMMMIVGNTSLLQNLRTFQNIALFVGITLSVFILSWIIGEYFYRKRHKQMHQPLLNLINELKSDLKEE
jgi:uncharacterized membrane protein HdeD (DUF308 family)